jgi:hypothetical protein
MRLLAGVVWVLAAVPALRFVLPAETASLQHDYAIAFVAMIVTTLLPRAATRDKRR